MSNLITRAFSLFAAFILAVCLVVPIAFAADPEDAEVAAVVTQLEAIDTLQEMQDERSKYTVKNRYDAGTTDPAIAAEHETARAGYRAYVSQMFAARAAAQQAYDALSDAQKAQIDSALVAKLSNDLPTVFNSGTYSVTPSEDEYTLEAVNGGTGLGYEVSNHMVAGEIPQTFILVDTSNGQTEWTPSGKYVHGESNYFVAYCCDVNTPLKYTTDYKRVNLEDSSYYGPEAARHIRAILQDAYPFVTMDEMKASLKAGGLDPDFVDSLTRADMISAVQMAIWAYSNSIDLTEDYGYFATVDVTKNQGIYFTALHDYTNECWDWLPGKRQRSYDAEAAYRVNNLAYYLCNLPGIDATDGQVVISDVSIARAELLLGTDDTYSIGMYVHIGNANKRMRTGDDLKITATSFIENADGTTTVHGTSTIRANGGTTYEMVITAKQGDTIKVMVEGTQNIVDGVYLYKPEGGRDVSQTLVGASRGLTYVRAAESFVFNKDVEMGLRVYKTATESGLPISNITFDVYKVDLADGEILGEAPTEDEIAKYKTDASKVGSIVTDNTGYGCLALEKGSYLVVEQHNKEKVLTPVDPFYISVPMPVEMKDEAGGADTEVTIEYFDIVSVYPKNTPYIPPSPPPIIPPPSDNVKGSFTILKHEEGDTAEVLKGAEFKVYRPATLDDTATETVSVKDVDYAVVPVTVEGAEVVLTTGTDGKATSPQLSPGSYFIVETKAPNGYRVSEDAIPVTVIANTMTTSKITYVPNTPANILPSTGGSGTFLLWAVGTVMVVGSVILLVTRKRASRDNE